MTIVAVLCIMTWAWLFFAGWQRYPAERQQLQPLRATRPPEPRHRRAVDSRPYHPGRH